MPTDEDRLFPNPLQGQLLRRSERREVAIFLRGQALWVADFVDGQGELIDAPTWFRFNCGRFLNSHARRRMILEAAVPLSEEIVERIERLSFPPSRSRGGTLVRLARAIAAHLPPNRFATMVADGLRRRRRPSNESAD